MEKLSYNKATASSFLSIMFLIANILLLPTSLIAEEGIASNTTALNVKNFGARGNGNHNDTAAIQKAINAVPKDGIVYVPPGKYMISAKISLMLKSDMHFKMHKDAILAAYPNNAERHYILDLSGVKNVEISGGRILGERSKHKGTTGEWGYGIKVGRKSLAGVKYPNPSSNILIRDVHISEMWGDGIMIGGGSHDVEVRNVVSTHNRRQGLTIADAYRIKIYNSEFSNTEGTAPESGIDIEPDPGNGRVARDILIQGCDFVNNKGNGLLIYKQTSDITLRWNRFDYNTYGVYVVNSDNASIYSNEFNHNTYHGLAIRGLTSNFEVKNNIFRNNSTKAVGLNETNVPLETITGVVNKKTTPHLSTGEKVENVQILTNRYSK